MTTDNTAPLRDRIIAAARQVTTEDGWADLTMQRLASVVGVSRQTIYNEVGNKEALAEAIVLDELGRFLAVVEDAFVAHPDDVVDAIRAAVTGVLEHAVDNDVLRAAVSSSHGADSDLLPLLTTRSAALLGVARDVVHKHVSQHDLDLPAARLDAAIDVVVRVVLSHVMQPSAAPSETANAIAWIASRVLSA